MGRELRRVPMDFDYPLDKTWYGFFFDRITTCFSTNGNLTYCEQCRKFAQIKGIPFDSIGCPDYDTYLAEPIKKLKELLAPPVGEGYQLWSTTSEGDPVSPVFSTLDALCEWCEENATTFATAKATKEQWKQMLSDGFVYHQENGVIMF